MPRQLSIEDVTLQKNTGVPMVWTFNGHAVKQRMKKQVDKEWNDPVYGSHFQQRTTIFATEIEARQAEVDCCMKKLEGAERAVKVADRALSRAEARLHKARLDLANR